MRELHVKCLLPVRLDKYLMEQFPALGIGRLNKALREKEIGNRSSDVKETALPF